MKVLIIIVSIVVFVVSQLPTETTVVKQKQEPKITIRDDFWKAEVKREDEQVEDAENSILDLIKKEFGDEWRVAYAVAMAESGMNPEAVGDKHCAKPSIGLFQINKIYHDHTTEDLMNPEYNIKVAKEISSKGRGWENWTTYRNGQYLSFL